MTLADAIEQASHGRKVSMLCPAHEDDAPSLSVGPGDDHPVVIKCFAGCETEAVLEAEGLGWADISAEIEKREVESMWVPGDLKASNIYRYYDAHGTLAYEVLRAYDKAGKKRFFQRQPDPDERSGYKWNLDGIERMLYRLPQVIDAVAGGATIHIPEGEKCVEALQRVLQDGDVATTNSGGAGRFTPDMADVLAGAAVVIYADSNEVGREHARDMREMLLERGCVVQILEAPPGLMSNGKPVGDVADHLEAGLPLSAMLETTPGSTAEKARSAVDFLDLVGRPETEFKFVIPGVLARSERLLLVGLEGHGKSHLMRQFAASVACGVHPFDGTPMEPKRVLYIDAENHPGQVLGAWKRMKWLIEQNGGEAQRGYLNILEEWDSEIDLTSIKGRAWLKERVHAYRPDLLLLGPLKNLVQRNLTDHDTVNALRYTINSARTISECAVILEHHAPLRSGGDKERELRPYGSGLFLGWPDFGYAMKPTQTEKLYEWQQFRGDRVRDRKWPEALRWGSGVELPWVPELLPTE
jgi:hypothetical protein